MTNRYTVKPRYPRGGPSIIVKVTAAEKRELERVAEELGVSVSEVVRRALRVTGALPSNQ